MVMVCGRHCHGLWPSWFVAVNVVAVTVLICGRHCCGHHGDGLWTSWWWFVAVMVCGRRCCSRHGLWPTWYSLSHYDDTEDKLMWDLTLWPGTRLVARLSYCRSTFDQQTYVWTAALNQLNCFRMCHVLRIVSIDLDNLVSNLLHTTTDEMQNVI